VHPLLIGHGFKDLIRCLGAQPKLMAFPIQIDHEVYNLHSHCGIRTFKVNNDNVTHGIHEHFNPSQ
jgi:hypothetical protein